MSVMSKISYALLAALTLYLLTGIVQVTLVGACGTCPASTQTLKAGIERIMRDRVDGVTEVVAV